MLQDIHAYVERNFMCRHSIFLCFFFIRFWSQTSCHNARFSEVVAVVFQSLCLNISVFFSWLFYPPPPWVVNGNILGLSLRLLYLERCYLRPCKVFLNWVSWLIQVRLLKIRSLLGKLKRFVNRNQQNPLSGKRVTDRNVVHIKYFIQYTK